MCSVATSHVWLFCDLMDCSFPGSTVYGISQARILEWVAIPFSRGSSWPRDRTASPALAGRFYTTEPPGKVLKVKVLVTQSCPTLCDPMDCSLPGSFVRGIFQARILEWIAISFSRGSSWPTSPALQADSLPTKLKKNITHRKSPLIFFSMHTLKFKPWLSSYICAPPFPVFLL